MPRRLNGEPFRNEQWKLALRAAIRCQKIPLGKPSGNIPPRLGRSVRHAAQKPSLPVSTLSNAQITLGASQVQVGLRRLLRHLRQHLAVQVFQLTRERLNAACWKSVTTVCPARMQTHGRPCGFWWENLLPRAHSDQIRRGSERRKN